MYNYEEQYFTNINKIVAHGYKLKDVTVGLDRRIVLPAECEFPLLRSMHTDFAVCKDWFQSFVTHVNVISNVESVKALLDKGEPFFLSIARNVVCDFDVMDVTVVRDASHNLHVSATFGHVDYIHQLPYAVAGLRLLQLWLTYYSDAELGTLYISTQFAELRTGITRPLNKLLHNWGKILNDASLLQLTVPRVRFQKPREDFSCLCEGYDVELNCYANPFEV